MGGRGGQGGEASGVEMSLEFAFSDPHKARLRMCQGGKERGRVGVKDGVHNDGGLTDG